MDWANDPSWGRDFFLFDLDGGSGGNADLVLSPTSASTSIDDDDAVDDVDDIDAVVPFRVTILR